MDAEVDQWRREKCQHVKHPIPGATIRPSKVAVASHRPIPVIPGLAPGVSRAGQEPATVQESLSRRGSRSPRLGAGCAKRSYIGTSDGNWSPVARTKCWVAGT